MSDHGDPHPAALEHDHRLEHRLVPFRIAHILREERKTELAHELLHPLGAEGELPMADHGVRLQQRHAIDHVLALADQGGVAVLPGIAAVEERHAVPALGTDRREDGGDAIETAQPAVGSRKRREIRRRQGVGRRRTRRDLVEVEQSLAADVRHEPPRLADSEIDRGLAKQHWQELAVNVGDVHEGDIADRVEAKQLVLGQALLRKGPRPAAGRKRGGGGCNLEKIAPRKHGPVAPARNLAARSP